MKKLIAILAVFAFLGAALFAQDAGTWSISGNGQINTRINLKPLYNSDVGAPFNYAQVGASNYGDENTFNNGDVKGNLTLKYTRGIIAAEVSFNQRGAMGANVQASGENFQFRASRDLANLFLHEKVDSGMGGFGDLWGNYTFQVLEGITLEAAYNKDAEHWAQGYESWTAKDRLGENYLLINAKPMAGLEVGVKIPNLFRLDRTNNKSVAGYFSALLNEDVTEIEDDDPRLDEDNALYDPLIKGLYDAYKATAVYNFMDDSLRRMVFGAKYSVAPITVAFQFGLNGYGLSYPTSGAGGSYPNNSNRIYFGAKYDIAPGIDAGVYFRGEFGYKAYLNVNPESSDFGKAVDTSEIVFGGSFNYSDGPLGAGLTFRFTEPNSARTADVPKTGTAQEFRVGLSARYDVLPDNLRAKLGFELRFPILGETSKKTAEESAGRADQALYIFTPEITYNFLGTGAGDDPGVGMKIKYRVEGRFLAEGNQQTTNSLTFAFKWSF
jgi:hypothetical protein